MPFRGILLEGWWRMVRLNKLMKKLQQAIVNKNVYLKVHQRQFLNRENGSMSTCYSVTLPKWSNEKQRMTDREVLKTCSAVEVVKFLAKMLEELQNEPDS